MSFTKDGLGRKSRMKHSRIWAGKGSRSRTSECGETKNWDRITIMENNDKL